MCRGRDGGSQKTNIFFENTTTDSPGLPDFHKLVFTLLKTIITESNPQRLTDRDIKILIQLDFMKS